MNNQEKINILIGDMCEAVPGKFVATSMDKDNKLKNIVTKYSYKKTNTNNFKKWKLGKVEEELKPYRQYKEDRFMGISVSEIKEMTKADILEVINVVEGHKPPLIELFEEAYQWFTYIRMVHSKQFLIHKNNLSIVNPSLFFNNLRTITKIHPELRVNYVMMDYFFKTKKNAKKMAKIPVAQIPMIPYTAPRVIKLLLWGIRATADRFLIKRMLKYRDANMRYRLFKSLDWPIIYQQEDGEANLRACIKNDLVDAEEAMRRLKKRKELRKTPLTTFDIALIVGLNEELNLIKNYTLET